MILRDPTSGARPKSKAIRKCWAELITEVGRTQREIISQSILLWDIGTIVIPQRTCPVRSIKAIHFPVVPFAVNRLPVMLDIFGIMEVELLGRGFPSLAIRL